MEPSDDFLRPEAGSLLDSLRHDLSLLCIGVAIIWVPLLLFFLAFVIF